MPIYAYKCSSCGHEKDVLQKVSDAPLSVCPACGTATFAKQITAAGFQLKGSGWYVTDFKNGSAGKSKEKPAEAKTESGDAKGGDSKATAPAAEPKAAAASTAGDGGSSAASS